MKLKVHFINGESKVFTRTDFSTFKAYMQAMKDHEEKPWLFFAEAPVRTEHVLYIEEAKEEPKEYHRCSNCIKYEIQGLDCWYCKDFSKYEPKED